MLFPIAETDIRYLMERANLSARQSSSCWYWPFLRRWDEGLERALINIVNFFLSKTGLCLRDETGQAHLASPSSGNDSSIWASTQIQAVAAVPTNPYFLRSLLR